MKTRRQPTTSPKAASASFKPRKGIRLLARHRLAAGCLAALILTQDIARSQEPGDTLEPDRDPAAEVIWQSGNADPLPVPAVRIEGEGWFVCLRPVDSPRAKPQRVRYLEQEAAIELLNSDFKTGLCLLRMTGEEAAGEFLIPRLSVAGLGKWPAPGSPVLAFDGKNDGPAEAKIAGRDLIYHSKELPVTRLRVNLTPGADIGGALALTGLDRRKLIGFLIPAPLENRGEFHAVPAVFVAKLIRDYQTLERSSSAKLGASFDVGSTTPQIVSVRKNSAADRAGLEENDVILQIGEWKISRLSDVIEVLRTLTPEDPVDVEVLRGLEAVTIEVVPESVKSGSDP